MKRNKQLLILLFLLLALLPLDAYSLRVEGRKTGSNSIDYHVELLVPDSDVLLQMLQADRQMNLRFEVRLYRKTTGPFSIFGDTILSAENLEYVISHDRISRQYIADSGNDIWYFTDFKTFMSHITNIFGSMEVNRKHADRLYLKVRCIINENIMEPPLKIIEFFFGNRNTRLEWVTLFLDTPEK